jgi:peptide/nickel transport system substrate-binding protein
VATYWSRMLESHVSRRRALGTTGAAAAGVALLAACGSGGSNSASKGDSNSLVVQPVETTVQARRTGVIKDRTFADPPSLSVSEGGSNPHNAVNMPYSALLQNKPGVLKPAEKETIGDIVEAWEWSPDGLQITMKLRPGVKFHNKPPVNGRELDIDDILLTWARFTRQSTARQNVANVANPKAPVLSLTATDSKTLVMKLLEPVVYVLGYFSSNAASGGLCVAPKETDTTFDSRGDMIGTGPYFLANYTQSVSFTFKRFPEYYDKDVALAAQIDMPIVPEYASALSQFKAGNIFSMGSYGTTPKVRQEDILIVKREEPHILTYQDDLGRPADLGASIAAFGWLPAGKSPFLDERVRQAFSMAWDRDLAVDTFSNVPDLRAQGMPVETRWNTHLVASEEGFWLDPKGKDFGPNARYFQHDPAEAKKLLSAAGYPNGFETLSNYVTSPEFPTGKYASVMDDMVRQIGIKGAVNSLDYAKEYQPKYRDGHGQYEGWAYTTSSGSGSGGDAVSSLATEFWSKGAAAAFHGFSTSGKNDQSGDPELDALIEKGRVERDTEKRRAIVFDLQRYLAKSVYSLQGPGLATGFTMAWPALGNFRVYRGGRLNHRLWVDETKPPFKS